MKIKFKKMVGTGNDFIVVDSRGSIFPAEDKTFVSRLCDRRYGVGADGIILLENSAQSDFKMRIINADGSEAEMCGNGARCAVRMAKDIKLFKGKKTEFQTLAGTIKASIIGDIIKLNMGIAKEIRLNIKVILDGSEKILYFVNTGVPHAVMFVDDIEKVDVLRWGREIRHNSLFKPAGTNVNFVKVMDSSTIKVRTYERGVEDETFSCGTGTCASAIMSHLVKGAGISIKSITAKNENLFVDFTVDSNGQPGEFFLSGPADCVFTGTVEKE
jgi:diaminopimelate epimerase